MYFVCSRAIEARFFFTKNKKNSNYFNQILLRVVAAWACGMYGSPCSWANKYNNYIIFIRYAIHLLIMTMRIYNKLK